MVDRLKIPDEWQELDWPDTQQENLLPEREFFLCEHLWDNKNIPPSEGIRTQKWKYFRYQKDPAHEELYDLENDPDEKNNLASVPLFMEDLNELRQKTDSITLDYEERSLVI